MKNIKKTGKIVTRITNTTLTLLVLILIPLMVFMLVSSKTDKLGGIQSFVVLSGSMSPKIPVGSVIFTMPKLTYYDNDIITFTRGGNTITHRIVERNVINGQAVFTTKGDANNKIDDGQILKSQVIGKELFFIPYVGRITSFLFTPQGFIGLIVIPIVLFIIFEIFNIKKELEKQIEAKYMKKLKKDSLNIVEI